MAQPPAYNREKNFTLNSGRETDHSALNAELDRASNAINDIRKNLALIQADDGKIRASSITTDSLDQEVLDYVQAKALAGANAVADAATAIARDAEAKAEQAVGTAAGAAETAGLAVEKADRAMEASGRAVEKAEQALSETGEIDGKVETAVIEAISGVTIPGLTPETIAGALGYTPYDGEANSKDFATTGEVAQAIAAIPEPVNADWNATEGPAQIRNRPELAGVATSGSYRDLSDTPVLSDVALSGHYGDLEGRPDIVSMACPVGFVYIQFAGQSAPAELFGGTWENISARYAGQFFRAEGGNAAAFGQTQGGGAPDISGYVDSVMHWGTPGYGGAFYAGWAQSGQNWYLSNSQQCAYQHNFMASRVNGTYTANEVRPVNSTIRIWKRTA